METPPSFIPLLSCLDVTSRYPCNSPRIQPDSPSRCGKTAVHSGPTARTPCRPGNADTLTIHLISLWVPPCCPAYLQNPREAEEAVGQHWGRALPPGSPRAFPQSQECGRPPGETFPGWAPTQGGGAGQLLEHSWWGGQSGVCSLPAVQRQALTHLLLVLPLRVESRLDALPGLLEGLSLGDLGRVVGADAHDVGAGENEDIGDELQRER